MIRRMVPFLLIAQLAVVAAIPAGLGATITYPLPQAGPAPSRHLAPAHLAPAAQPSLAAGQPPLRAGHPSSLVTAQKPGQLARQIVVRRQTAHIGLGKARGAARLSTLRNNASLGPQPQITFFRESGTARSAEGIVLPGDTLFVRVSSFPSSSPMVTVTLNGANPVATSLVDGSGSVSSYPAPPAASPGRILLSATDGTTTVSEALIIGVQLNVTTAHTPGGTTIRVEDSSVAPGLSSFFSSPLYSAQLFTTTDGTAAFAVPANTHLEVTADPVFGGTPGYAPIHQAVSVGASAASVTLDYAALDPFQISGTVSNPAGLPAPNALYVTGINGQGWISGVRVLTSTTTASASAYSYTVHLPAGSYYLTQNSYFGFGFLGDKGATVSAASPSATVNLTLNPPPTTTPAPTLIPAPTSTAAAACLTTTVTGAVTIAGVPAPGAFVRAIGSGVAFASCNQGYLLTNLAVSADANGIYTFTVLQSTPYSVTAGTYQAPNGIDIYAGTPAAVVTVGATPGAGPSFDYATADPAVVGGSVTHSDGTEVSSAVSPDLKASSGSPDLTFSLQRGSSASQFAFHVPAGSYTLAALEGSSSAAAPYVAPVQPIVATASATTAANIVFSPPAFLSGTVPAAHVDPTILSVQAQASMALTTTARVLSDNSYSLELLPNTTYSVSAPLQSCSFFCTTLNTGYLTTPAPLGETTGSASSTTAGPSLDLDAANPFVITGTVSTNDNSPVPIGFSVHASGSSSSTPGLLLLPYNEAIPPASPYTFYSPADTYSLSASGFLPAGGFRTSNTGTASPGPGNSPAVVSPRLILGAVSATSTPGTPGTPANTSTPPSTPTPAAGTATNTPLPTPGVGLVAAAGNACASQVAGASAAPTEPVTATISNFQPGETISVTYPAGASTSTTVTATADGAGNAVVSFTFPATSALTLATPPNALPGDQGVQSQAFTVQAVGLASGKTATASISSCTTSIVASPNPATPGGPLTLNGSGYLPNEQVAVTYYLTSAASTLTSTLAPTATFVVTAMTNGTGSFIVTTVAPTTVGHYTLRGKGLSSSLTGTGALAVAMATSVPTTAPVVIPSSVPLPTNTAAAATNTAPNTPVPTATLTPAPTAPASTATLVPTSTLIPAAPRTQSGVGTTSTATETPATTAGATATATATAALIGVTTAAVLPDQAAVLEALVQQPAQGTAAGQGTPQLLRLLVPVGTFSQTVTLQVSTADLSTVPQESGDLGVSDNIGLGAAFDLVARNAKTGALITNLAQEVALQLSYDPGDLGGIDPAALHIAYFNTTTSRWTAIDTSVDTTNHLLTALVPHFTLFQVRATARTQAQVQQAQARLAARAAGGPPRVSILPGTNNAPVVDNVPLLVNLPSGQIHAPIMVLVTGKPGATVAATFVMSGFAPAQRQITLDLHGYAQVQFVPAKATNKAQSVHVTIVVRGTRDSQNLSSTFTLLPGRGPAGSTALNLTKAPALGLGARVQFSSSRVRVGQTVTVKITTAGLAPVQIKAYVGRHHIASAKGRADKSGVFLYHLNVVAGFFKIGVPKGGVPSIVITATAQSDGHTASGAATLFIRP